MAERIARISELNSLRDYIKYDVNTNGLSIYKVKKVTSGGIAGLQFVDDSNNVLSDSNYPMLNGIVKEPFIIDMSSIGGNFDSSLFRSNGVSGATYTVTIYNSSYTSQLLYIPNDYQTSELWGDYCLVYTESNNCIVPFKSVPYKQTNWNATEGMLGYIKNKPESSDICYSRDYYTKQYFTIEAITAGTVTIVANPSATPANVLYSTNNGSTWTSITPTSASTSIKTLAVGEKILFKGANSKLNYGLVFGGTAQTKVYGNIMSLLYGDNFVGQITLDSTGGNFAYLFSNYTNLISAENLILPATTLASYCYYYMFSGCTSLTKAPKLPAITLASNCYNQMFYGCTSLTKAPELPATTLSSSCYYQMFYACTSLTKASELPATTLANNCYNGMFYGCTSLTKAPELPATTLASYCYSNMFNACTSLTKTPELPATVLASNCYKYMFYGCTSLTKAPELPATTLADNCYQTMFRACTSLNYVKALFTTTPSNSYTQDWLYGVALTGTFVKSNEATWTNTGTNAVPTGWYIELLDDILTQPTTASSYTINPNKVYILGTITQNTIITLGNHMNNQSSEYSIMFDIGSTTYTVSFSTTITWQSSLDISANHHYEINIIRDTISNAYYGNWLSWEISHS